MADPFLWRGDRPHPEEVRNVLSDLYPTGKNTWRPLDVKCCNNLAAVVSYAIEPYFYRPSGYVNPLPGAEIPGKNPSRARKSGSSLFGSINIGLPTGIWCAAVSETEQAYRHRPCRQSPVARVAMTANYLL
jgi:hypothetical protein